MIAGIAVLSGQGEMTPSRNKLQFSPSRNSGAFQVRRSNIFTVFAGGKSSPGHHFEIIGDKRREVMCGRACLAERPRRLSGLVPVPARFAPAEFTLLIVHLGYPPAPEFFGISMDLWRN